MFRPCLSIVFLFFALALFICSSDAVVALLNTPEKRRNSISAAKAGIVDGVRTSNQSATGRAVRRYPRRMRVTSGSRFHLFTTVSTTVIYNTNCDGRPPKAKVQRSLCRIVTIPLGNLHTFIVRCHYDVLSFKVLKKTMLKGRCHYSIAAKARINFRRTFSGDDCPNTRHGF